MKKTIKTVARLLWFNMIIGASVTELIINIKRFIEFTKEG